MKRIYAYTLTFILLLTGCDFNNEYSTSPWDNFEALWKIIDENYCFFDYKQIGWDVVYEEYSSYIYEDMDNDYLFSILSNMLYELKDGHVNLFWKQKISSYDDWQYENSLPFNIYFISTFYMKNNYSFFLMRRQKKLFIIKLLKMVQ